jgi:hypothetical protein
MTRLVSYVLKRDSVTMEVDEEQRTVALWHDVDGVRTPLPSPDWPRRRKRCRLLMIGCMI